MTTLKGINLEKTVLAAMLTNEDCALEVELLSQNDFINTSNREIYNAIRYLIKKGKPVDYVTVYEQMNQKVDLSYLADLTDMLPTTAHFEQYVSDLKEATLKREIKDLAARVLQGEEKGSTLVELVESEIYRLREGITTEDFISPSSLALETFEEIERTQAGEMETVVPTGYEGMDRLMNGGFRKGEYILLGARPSMGKTALSLNLVTKMLEQDKSVAYFSMEMPARTLQKRILAGISFINMGKLMHHQNKMSAADWDKIIKATDFISNSKLQVTDDPTLTVAQIQSMARKLKRKQGLDIIVIDYLQRVNSTVQGDRRLAIEQISRDLKSMATILDIPVLVITSLSRGNEHLADKRPTLTHLRESGQLEFDADVVMFLHRENYYDPSANPLEAELIVAKNRNGQLGIVDLIWKSEYTSFFSKSYREG